MNERLPLLHHRVSEPSAFKPEGLIEAVKAERKLASTTVPPICVLDFDGDMTDWLVDQGIARRYSTWACFHTKMYSFEIAGVEYGIVARTIGGPYAVLVAEQLLVSGAQIQIGLTSAGRVAASLPVPGLVVATGAVRDEGTSFHYLPPAETVEADLELATYLHQGLSSLDLPILKGRVWTTDAPYRETLGEIRENEARGTLAVEMQAASLFAFAQARNTRVGIVAHVTNAVDHTNDPFDKGPNELGWEIVQAMCTSARQCLLSSKE